MNEARPSSRRRRYLWIVGIVLLLFTVFGFFIAPGIVKSQLERRASEFLGRTVTVGKVRVNPYTVALTLENFDVRLKEGNGSFVGWDRLYVNFDPLASVLGTWTFGAIELDGFHAAATLMPDGSFNFDDIIQRMQATASSGSEKGPLPAVHVGSLKVAGARLDFSDQSRLRSFATAFGPVSLSVTEFRTTGQQGAPYHFEAVTEAGEKFDWSGTLSAEPFRSSGSLAVENIHLPKYLAYYGDRVKGEVRDGKLTFRGRYTLDLTEGARVVKLAGGELQLRGVQVAATPDGELAAELPALDVTGIEADALAMKATVSAVTVNGGRVRVEREADGALNLLTMLEPSAAALAAAPFSAPAAPAASPTTGPAPALPDFLVGEIAVKDFQVDIVDRAAPRPAQLSIGGLQVALKNVTLAEGAVIPVSAAFNWAPGGTVKAEGTVALKPELKADLKTDVAAFALLPLSPYLEQFLNARITQGTVATAGVAQVALAGGLPAITYAGNVSVEKLGLVDGVHNEELAGFASLTLTDLKAATAPQLAVSLGEVSLAAPYARVIVSADRSINLLSVLKTDSENVGGALRPDSSVESAGSGPKAPPTSQAPALAAAAPAAPLPDIKIGRIVIAGGEFSLVDRSIEPNVRTRIDSFGGIISGLSSDNLTRADINLTATMDGVAPVMIAGKLDPLGAKPFIDIEIDAKNVELLPFSPYSGRYAGYELARGKLSSNLKFKLDGKQMDATDIITLNGFTFGAPVQSPDATSLPVRLGVALLKDQAGQIVIDVPVSGNIDDPEVRLRKAIIRVIVNLLTKAAVSPFSLLGSLMGGGGEELAFQEFAPGLSMLQADQRPKLETVVKMLNSRPALGVALEGAYDGPADTYALQRLKLADQIRRKIWEERHAVEPNIPPPDQLEVTPEQNIAMIRKLYDAKFPPGTEFGAPLPEKPVVQAPPPAPKKGFLKKVVSVITLEDLRKGTGEEQKVAGLKEDYAAALQVAAETGLPLEEMVGRLAQAVEVTDNDLHALATARAESVRDYFLGEGKITADRIFLTRGTEAAKANKGPRVFLSPQ
jgi:hypothetical protein